MSSSRSYLTALNRRFQFLGAWPPNQRIEVGEVGVIEQGVFRRRTSLGHLGIPFSASSSGQVGNLDYSEGAEISTDNSASADVRLARGAPKVGIHVKLNHEGAFVFNAMDAVEWRVDDVIAIERHVLAALERGAWDPSWVIVDRVIQATSLTVLISESDGAELGLNASGALNASALKLADASLGLQTAYATGQSLRFLGEVGLTPLYQCLRVNRRLFGRDRLETAGPLSFGTDEPALERVGLESETSDAQ